MSARDVSALAIRYSRGDTPAPGSFGTAQAMPAKVRTGRAASRHNGVGHIVAEAASCSDGTTAVLATRWACGKGSVSAMVTDEDHPVACRSCAEAVRLPRGPVVYRCFDATGALLYIGSTSNLVTRLNAHRVPSGSYWWDEVADVQASPQISVAAARIEESRAIATEAPLYNRAGSAKSVQA